MKKDKNIIVENIQCKEKLNAHDYKVKNSTPKTSPTKLEINEVESLIFVLEEDGTEVDDEFVQSLEGPIQTLILLKNGEQWVPRGMRKPKTKRPTITKKNAIKKGYKNSPGRIDRCRRALLAIENRQVTFRKASDIYDLSYGYLQRRLSSEVDIESQNGQSTVFNKTEEEALAHWLHEMACHGMGLKPAEFDHVQQIVTKENRKTPFINNIPGYDWYYGFLKRNSHIIQIRSETPLETCRSRVTKRITDVWYSCFREFLISKGLIYKPSCIWNADETGFSIGSVSGKVIGPSRTHHSSQVPHLSGGPSKQRLTVMFCGSAAGTMMPPDHFYPEPKPRGYNPLTGALHGSDIAYTKKGWIDSTTFVKCSTIHPPLFCEVS